MESVLQCTASQTKLIREVFLRGKLLDVILRPCGLGLAPGLGTCYLCQSVLEVSSFQRNSLNACE